MMKKFFMAFAATLMMSATCMAQDNSRQQRRVMDKDEMIKQRTEQMVKDYGLNEEQAAKLLQLNTEYADKLPFMAAPGPRDGQRPQMGEQAPKPDSTRQAPPQHRQRPDSTRQAPPQHRQHPDSARQVRLGRGERPQMDREEMRKNIESYQQEVEKIMTEEQFAKYKEDQHKRMRQGRRGGGQRMGQGQRQRQRPQRDNNNE